LEYEGQFRYNRKWNGKGYDEKGNIIYELINGNGKVKEYDNIYGKLRFEGEYLNGQRNGKGKEFDVNGKLIYEGEYLNDRRKKINIVWNIWSIKLNIKIIFNNLLLLRKFDYIYYLKNK